jgi:hypothetical protein
MDIDEENAERLFKEALAALDRREEVYRRARFDPYGRMTATDWACFQTESEKEKAAWRAYLTARDLYRARTKRM